MFAMFDGASDFNQDLSPWDVSNVTSIHWMFRGASSFDGDISTWDVSNVTNVELMFQSVSSLIKTYQLGICLM